MINPNKTKSIRELGRVDISQLKYTIAKISDKVWLQETATRENNFDCFHHTQHIIFRFPDDIRDRTIVHSNPIWNVWKPLLLPVINKAVEPYGYKNGSIKAVMLAKLLAGYELDRHIDGSHSYYFLHKIHIPIQTHDDVDFYIEPHTYNLKEGIAYEVNNIVSHSVNNRSDKDRIHLIFEYHNEDNSLDKNPSNI